MPQQQQSIFDQVHAAGAQWREYLQTTHGACGTGTAAFYPSLAAQCAGGTAYPGCQVAFLAVGPAVAQTRSEEYFTHYSRLRTTEEMLGISTHLGAAAKAHSMRSALHL